MTQARQLNEMQNNVEIKHIFTFVSRFRASRQKGKDSLNEEPLSTDSHL